MQLAPEGEKNHRTITTTIRPHKLTQTCAEVFIALCLGSKKTKRTLLANGLCSDTKGQHGGKYIYQLIHQSTLAWTVLHKCQCTNADFKVFSHTTHLPLWSKKKKMNPQFKYYKLLTSADDDDHDCHQAASVECQTDYTTHSTSATANHTVKRATR